MYVQMLFDDTLTTGEKYDEIVEVEDEEFVDPQKAKPIKTRDNEESKDLESEQSLDDTSDADEVTVYSQDAFYILLVWHHTVK